MTDDKYRLTSETADRAIPETTPDTEDFPPMPEWEAAFQQYAKETAPDLLPGILAKIDSGEASRKPAEKPVTESPPSKGRTGKMIPFLFRASCVAAAVLAVVICFSLFRGISHENSADNTSSYNDEITPSTWPSASIKSEHEEDTLHQDLSPQFPSEEAPRAKDPEHYGYRWDAYAPGGIAPTPSSFLGWSVDDKSITLHSFAKPLTKTTLRDVTICGPIPLTTVAVYELKSPTLSGDPVYVRIDEEYPTGHYKFVNITHDGEDGEDEKVTIYRIYAAERDE